VRTIVLLAAMLLLLVGCGNNRVRGQWDDTRDAINRPFK
jgi:hypothetical protein